MDGSGYKGRGTRRDAGLGRVEYEKLAGPDEATCLIGHARAPHMVSFGCIASRGRRRRGRLRISPASGCAGAKQRRLTGDGYREPRPGQARRTLARSCQHHGTQTLKVKPASLPGTLRCARLANRAARGLFPRSQSCAGGRVSHAGAGTGRPGYRAACRRAQAGAVWAECAY